MQFMSFFSATNYKLGKDLISSLPIDFGKGKVTTAWSWLARQVVPGQYWQVK